MPTSSSSSSSKPTTLVAHVVVVGFHATHGNHIEFAYPRLRGSVILRSPKISDSADISGHGDPTSPSFFPNYYHYPSKNDDHAEINMKLTKLLKKNNHNVNGDWGLLPEEWSFLPFMALPDGSHNLESDTIFFTLPPDVHCVACYRQIRTEHLKTPEKPMKKESYGGIMTPKARSATTTTTRGSIQKSIVLLCKRPIYGLVTNRLRNTVKNYFEQGNFNQTNILVQLYHSINEIITKQSCLTNDLIFHQGLELKQVLRILGPQILSILKIILLEKKLIIYSQPVYTSSNVVTSILSIFPGSFHELSPNMLSLNVSNTEKQFGFPLALFSTKSNMLFQPHAPLPLLSTLLNQNKGCLIGTSQNVGVLLTSSAISAARKSNVTESSNDLRLLKPLVTKRKSRKRDSQTNLDKSYAPNESMRDDENIEDESLKSKQMPAVDALVNLKNGKVVVNAALEPLCRLTNSERIFMMDLISAISSSSSNQSVKEEHCNDYIRKRLREYLFCLFGTVASIPGIRGGPRGTTWSREMVDRFDLSIASEFGEEFVCAWLQTRNAARAAKKWDKRIARRRKIPCQKRANNNNEEVEGTSLGLDAGSILKGLRENFARVGQLAEAGAQGIGSFFKTVETEMVRMETAVSASSGKTSPTTRGTPQGKRSSDPR